MIISAVIVLGFFQFYRFLKKRVVVSDLKAVTEKRMSAFLKVPVHVDKINVGLLKHISLSGLKIGQTQTQYPSVLGIKKIVISYDLLSFLKRNFKVPTEVFLDAPRLTFRAFEAAGSLFDINLLRSDHGILTRFEFEDGQVELPWFRSAEGLRLTAIEGKAVPKKGELFDVRFKSRLSGGAEGSVLAYGEVNLTRKTYQLEMTLSDIAFSAASRIPISHLNGDVSLQGDTVTIRQIHFLFRGIRCELSGRIESAFSEKPMIALSVKIQESRFPIHLEVKADFNHGEMRGNVRYLRETHPFSGSLIGRPSSFRVEHLKVHHFSEASSQFDLRSGIYQLEWEKASGERFQINFSIEDFNSKLILKTDHLKLFGFDLVTYATFNLKPDEEEWQRGDHGFDLQMETDYLILQYQLLRDFHASARLSVKGLEEVVARWGNISELRGKVSFGQVPEADLRLRMGRFSLSELESFGTHPLPMSLMGTLEGTLDIKGPLDQPQLEGAFTIEGGTVGKLDYDRAMIHFSGRLPYLLLKDSKVVKGKNTFLLKGGFDFELQNFLEGVHVDNLEHVVIWKGIELSSELKGRVPGDFSTHLERSGTSGLRGMDTRSSKVEAEYKIGSRTSLSVAAEESKTQEESLTAGSKIRF